MSTLSELQAVLDRMSSVYDTPNIVLDEATRSCSVNFEDQQEVLVFQPSESDRVYLASPVADLSDENREEVYEKALKLNFLAIATKGAVFSIDDSAEQMLLSVCANVESLDEHALAELLAEFLGTLKNDLLNCELV